MPRFIALLHGDPDSESDRPPSAEELQKMHAYNATLVGAGIMLGGEGLHATSKGARVTFAKPSGTTTTTTGITVAVPGEGEQGSVTKGPFKYPAMHDVTDVDPTGPATRPVCGFWILKAKDLDEAIGWMRKAPLEGTYVEVRELWEMEDMGDNVPAEVKKEEEQWRRDLEK